MAIFALNSCNLFKPKKKKTNKNGNIKDKLFYEKKLISFSKKI